MIGNKTFCDICSSKVIRKKNKKEKDVSATPTIAEPPTDNLDELAASSASTSVPPPPSTQHHHSAHDEGISRKLKSKKYTQNQNHSTLLQIQLCIEKNITICYEQQTKPLKFIDWNRKNRIKSIDKF